MAGEIRFFELGVEDVERGRAFYGGLFGWRFERGPSVEGDADQVAQTGRFKLCRDDQGSPFGLHEPPRGS